MDMKQFVNKYFGPDQIKEVSLLADTTYLKKERVEIEFKNESKFQLPLKVLKQVMTKEPLDLSDLREKRVIPVVEELIISLLESELGKDDLYYAITLKLLETVKAASKSAEENVFGKPQGQITLLDLERQIRKKHV